MAPSNALVAAHATARVSRTRSMFSALRSTWYSIRGRIPIKWEYPYRLEPTPISLHTVSYLYDTDYDRPERKITSTLFVTNPDPDADWDEWEAYLYPQNDSSKTDMPASTSTLANTLWDTDMLTPEQENILNIVLRAGRAAQNARGVTVSRA